MNNPKLYQEINNNQTRDVINLLEAYGNKMRWKPNCKVVDLGSGDGRATATVLTKYLPKDFNSVLGIDISKDMVSHSTLHYSSDKVKFSMVDIAGPLPYELKGTFHHAFSFNVLHWISDQEKAFKNVYDMLTVDGDCLIMLVCWSPFYDYCRVLSRTEKWSPRLTKTIDSIVTRYHDLEDQNKIEEVWKIMTEAGFKNLDVKIIESSFVFDGVEGFKKFAQALNLFKLPKDLLEEFGEDVSQVFLQQTGQEGSNSVTLGQKNLAVYGSK